MTQPTAAQGKVIDKNNNPQLQNRQAAIVTLTDNSAGTGSDTIGALSVIYAPAEHRNNLASLRDKIEEIQAVLRLHGLIAD